MLEESYYFYDEIKYYIDRDCDEEDIEIFELYKDCSLDELIKYYSAVQANKDAIEEDRKIRLEILRKLMHKELDLCELDRFKYFFKDLNGVLKELDKKIDEFKTMFKNHRHPKEKSYSDKPVW